MKRLLVSASLAATLALLSACETTPQRPPPRRGGFHPAAPANPEQPTEESPEDNQKPEKTEKPDKTEKPSPNEQTVNPVPEPVKQVGEVPYGRSVPNKPGFVTSPFSPYSGYIDVRGFPPGTEVKDPYSGKTILVP